VASGTPGGERWQWIARFPESVAEAPAMLGLGACFRESTNFRKQAAACRRGTTRGSTASLRVASYARMSTDKQSADSQANRVHAVLLHCRSRASTDARVWLHQQRERPADQNGPGLDVDGLKIKVELDFGVGAVDYRAAVTGAGA